MPRTAIDYNDPYTESSFPDYLSVVPKTLAFCVTIVYPGTKLIRRSSVYADGGTNEFFVSDQSEVFQDYKVGDWFTVRGFRDDCKSNNGCFQITSKSDNNGIVVDGDLVNCTDDFGREFHLGQCLAFTEWDTDIVFNGITYKALPGFNRTAIQITNKLEDDNFEIRGHFHTDGFTRENVLNHIYDNAYCEIFICDPVTPDRGRFILNKGILGEFSPMDDEYVVHFRSNLSRLKTATIGRVYQPTCRFKLAGEGCQQDLTKFMESGVVTLVDSKKKFAVQIDIPTTWPDHIDSDDYIDYATLDAQDESADGSEWYHFWWKDGLITFTSAANSGNEGKTFQIKFADKIVWPPDATEGYVVVFELWESPVYEVTVDDEFTITPGCDKIFSRGCNEKFRNIHKVYKVLSGTTLVETTDSDPEATHYTYRFGGEPFLIGNAALKPFGSQTGLTDQSLLVPDNGNQGE